MDIEVRFDSWLWDAKMQALHPRDLLPVSFALQVKILALILCSPLTLVPYGSNQPILQTQLCSPPPSLWLCFSGFGVPCVHISCSLSSNQTPYIMFKSGSPHLRLVITTPASHPNPAVHLPPALTLSLRSINPIDWIPLLRHVSGPRYNPAF